MDAERIRQRSQAVAQQVEEAQRLTGQARRVLAAAEERLRRAPRSRVSTAATTPSGARTTRAK
jgi:hypothetical protein